MKAIILAAGEGRRLRPFTLDKPKCMVEYQNKKIIDYILSSFEQCSLTEIAIINGYKKERLETYLNNQNIIFFTNINYSTTNMLTTLFCAREFMDDDLIISYADIVYDPNILSTLINSQGDFNIIIDRKYNDLWQQRMSDPLEDLETLKIHNNKIIEIGKKALSYNDIQGQYIGLIKISKRVLNTVINFYDKLTDNSNEDTLNMYMTQFIQLIIDQSLLDINPIYIDGGWVEIDCIEDLKSQPV